MEINVTKSHNRILQQEIECTKTWVWCLFKYLTSKEKRINCLEYWLCLCNPNSVRNIINTHPSNSISGRGCPTSCPLPTPPMPAIKPLGGTRPPFNQYETGVGDASTWHSNCTSEPNGAPNNWLGARTEGATIQREKKMFVVRSVRSSKQTCKFLCKHSRNH